MILPSIDLQQMSKVAHAVSTWAQPGLCIALFGDLGSGKTTFSRLFLQSLDPQITQVPSPTFTLVQVYPLAKADIWHCDLYRLKTPEEAIELGLEDAFSQAICLIEWPEKLDYYLPKKRLEIYFEINLDQSRHLTFKTVGFTDDQLQHSLHQAITS